MGDLSDWPIRAQKDIIYGPPVGAYSDRDKILAKIPTVYGTGNSGRSNAYPETSLRSYMSHLNRGVEYVSKGIEQLKAFFYEKMEKLQATVQELSQQLFEQPRLAYATERVIERERIIERVIPIQSQKKKIFETTSCY